MLLFTWIWLVQKYLRGFDVMENQTISWDLVILPITTRSSATTSAIKDFIRGD
jgi:hypothetical protein